MGDVLCDGSDFDGDGRVHSGDCLPFDGSIFDAAPEVVRIDVTKTGAFTLVTWASLATASGTGTRYEIAGSALAALQGPAAYAPPCIATNVSGPAFAIWSTSPSEAFLVRAVTP